MRLVILLWTLFFAMQSGALADCQSDVDSAFDKLRASKSFRLRTTIVNPQGSLRMTVDYVLPDRMHQRVSVGTGAGPLELIVIGTKAWSNNGQGWAEMPSTFAEQVAGQIAKSVAQPPQGKNDFSCLGEKEFEGKSYFAYRAFLAPSPEQARSQPSGSNVQTVYIDQKTGLPERNIVTAGPDSEDRLFDGTFSFPEALTIEPPATGPAAPPPVPIP